MSKELKNQDFVAKELAKYSLPDAKIAELKEKFCAVVVGGVDDKENYEIAKTAHIEIKTLRKNIEKKRVELKASSLEFGRKVDAEAKRLTLKVVEIEEHLLSQRKIVEDEKARIKKEKEDAIRAEEARIQREEKERIEKEQKEENDRLEKIRLEQEAKAKELEEKETKIREENDRIAKAQAKKEQELKAEEKRIQQAKRSEEMKPYIIVIRDFLGMLNAEESEYQEMLSDSKIAMEDHIAFEKKKEEKRKEQEKLAEEKAEKERVEREKAKEEERIKQAGDKGLIEKLLSEFKAINIPEVKSKKLSKKIQLVGSLIDQIIKELED